MTANTVSEVVQTNPSSPVNAPSAATDGTSGMDNDITSSRDRPSIAGHAPLTRTTWHDFPVCAHPPTSGHFVARHCGPLTMRSTVAGENISWSLERIATSPHCRCAVVFMKCLWITLADPDPAVNGQLIYSKG